MDSPTIGPRSMQENSLIVASIHDMVRRHNRELAIETLVRAVLGVAVSCVVFGMVFCLGWLIGPAVTPLLGLRAWHFAAILASVFVIVATWSAWRKVNPLAGLQPISDQEMLVMLISHAALDTPFLSPRHAVAGVAVVLIGGPASVLQSIGAWAWRIRTSGPMIEQAASLLAACQTNLPIEDVRVPAAALMLKLLRVMESLAAGAARRSR